MKNKKLFKLCVTFSWICAALVTISYIFNPKSVSVLIAFPVAIISAIIVSIAYIVEKRKTRL